MTSTLRMPSSHTHHHRHGPRPRGFALATAAALLLLASAAPGGAERARAATPATRLDPRALRAVDRLQTAWDGVQSLQYRLRKSERMRDGELVYEETLVKYARPGRIYIRRLQPREGQEVLYDVTRDRQKLIAHPGHFPDLTLRLKIEGGLATKDQHHAVTSTGFAEVITVLRRGIDLARKQPAGEQLRYLGEHEMQGRPAIGLELRAGRNPDRQETALEDESLFDFARRVGMDAYPIFVANPQIGDLDDDLDGGENYTIPAYYAHRGRIWLDAESHLPLRVTMWDSQGRLYEDYRHYDMQVDPPFGDADFDPDNPAYGF